MHKFLKFIFGIKPYMFRTVPLTTIRSFPLYTQQWYMSYRSADSLRAGSQAVSFPSLYVNHFSKNCLSASSPQRQIQLAVVLISSELKLSHLVILDIICISEGTPTIYVSFCLCRFMFVRFIIPCNLWQYIVLSVMGHLAVTSSR